MAVIDNLIHRYFETFNSRADEERLLLLHVDVAHDVNEGGTEVGRERFAAFIDHMNACYEETITSLVVMSNGNVGAAEFYVDGRYIGTDSGLPEATGQTYRIRAAAFFETDGEVITRITSYYNLREWIAAIS